MLQDRLERISRRGRNAHATLEQLEALVELDDALLVLERALETAKLHAVPEEPGAFALFVCGALFDAIAECAGEPIARSLSDRLTAGPHDVVPPETTGRVAVVASDDAQRARHIAAALRGTFVVREADDLVRLVALVEEHFGTPLLLVVDGHVPGLDGAALPTLARLLAADSKIVFRGDPPSGLYDVSLEWATLADDASASAVAALCLPEKRPPAKDAPETSEPSRRPLRERPSVVVVDHDEPARLELARRLEADGYSVVPVADALTALEICIEQDTDLVVAAADLPLLDGPALARLARGRLGSAAPPVILRGECGPADASVARVLPKGAPPSELLSAVRALAPRHRA